MWEAKQAGYVEGLKQAGYTCAEAKQAGYTCAEAKRAGYVDGLKQAGYSCGEAKAAGYSFEEAKAAGYTKREMSRDGDGLSPWHYEEARSRMWQ